ncbi:Asp-tRNA(Asn)/Glu-tRNA(Gln) amidotransferase subunit GatA [Bythopirellula polymerisocia]|uniref:Glutamyl-tRNA(Gln) amidotransferase subunit A n=1 Tax=Bythopirellula polymerisocia TaxID=2528003 RepID=A0A5C6CXG7_9BACT|nr:Asp-tRNA(Asn)/Glu-tRNA(Gln) amidotransferase subunit GatA [Bythopirellula polymerisocia]TWU27329.1 Glutamyl-tRNA(Gln) amidotransferase subunit A [Bythopirellula polymerisocia]
MSSHSSLIESSATAQLELLMRGDLFSVELTQAYLDSIASRDANVGAFLRVEKDRALAQAASVDKRRQSNKPLGKLAGLPVAVKDVLCDQDTITTCASRMLENFRAPYDSTVVAKLKAADAILIGRTNMDEFAMGGSTENSAFQITRNPWDLERAPGGSSGGAAACVAADMAPLSIGTDTGGSIRQPAGLCGVVGLKPTYGRVSRFGLVAFASSLDQVGPLARTSQDAALLLETIAGHDLRDATSLDRPVPAYSQSVAEPLAGVRIGLVREHFAEGLDSEVASAVRDAVAVYESLGATVKEISLPHSKHAVATYYVIAPCEASSNLARYDGVHYGHRTDEAEMLEELAAERKALEAAKDEVGLSRLDSSLVRMYRKSRSEGFGAEVKRRIMLGTYALSAGYYDAYYLKALKVRRLIRQDFDEAFREVDLIAGPVTAQTAFKIGEMVDDPLSMYLVDLYTVSANLAGIPGISLPCGFDKSGLPIGLQLLAPPLEEERLLRGAHMYEQATDWHQRRPEI